MFTYSLRIYILCEHVEVRFRMTALIKVLETCPSASHAKQLLEGSKTKHQKKSVCIVSKDVQHFNKNAEL